MPKRSWTIRKAIASDGKALAECMHAAYTIYRERLSGKTLPPLTVDYEEEICSYPVWVAISDGTVVGGLILMPVDDHMKVANVAVHPHFQGHGLGRGLMELAEAEAKRRGYSELRLATHLLLTENLSLYTHLGWSETGRDKDRVHMKKNII
jgi:GNAT superfamily N-acetyltransferase